MIYLPRCYLIGAVGLYTAINPGAVIEASEFLRIGGRVVGFDSVHVGLAAQAGAVLDCAISPA